MSYWVIVVARNANQHLPPTLDSLLRQTISPERVIVVDDGSTDGTGRIALNYKERYNTINMLTLPNRGYDIRRVPSNINLAWKQNAETGLRTGFFMISGDDCSYPTSYAEALISRMQSNERLVVASGLPSSAGARTREHAVSGSGRMIKSSFWVDVGGQYPVRAGWETWLLYTAAMRAGDSAFQRSTIPTCSPERDYPPVCVLGCGHGYPRLPSPLCVRPNLKERPGQIDWSKRFSQHAARVRSVTNRVRGPVHFPIRPTS